MADLKRSRRIATAWFAGLALKLGLLSGLGLLLLLTVQTAQRGLLDELTRRQQLLLQPPAAITQKQHAEATERAPTLTPQQSLQQAVVTGRWLLERWQFSADKQLELDALSDWPGLLQWLQQWAQQQPSWPLIDAQIGVANAEAEAPLSIRLRLQQRSLQTQQQALWDDNEEQQLAVIGAATNAITAAGYFVAPHRAPALVAKGRAEDRAENRAEGRAVNPTAGVATHNQPRAALPQLLAIIGNAEKRRARLSLQDLAASPQQVTVAVQQRFAEGRFQLTEIGQQHVRMVCRTGCPRAIEPERSYRLLLRPAPALATTVTVREQ